MASILASVLGCEAIDKFSADEIEAGLEKKYGSKFTVTALGDRFDRTTVTAYAHPNGDEALMFTVTANGSGEIIDDCYAYRTVCRQVELITSQAFREENLTVSCIADFIDCSSDTSAGVSVDEFVQDNGAHTLKIAVAAEKSEALTGKTIEKILSEISHDLPDITVVYSIFVLFVKDAETVIPKVQTEVYLFGKSRLKQLGADSEITEICVEASGDKLSKTADEMDALLWEASEQ